MTISITWPWWVWVLTLSAVLVVVGVLFLQWDDRHSGWRIPGNVGWLGFCLVTGVPWIWVGVLLGRWLH